MSNSILNQLASAAPTDFGQIFAQFGMFIPLILIFWFLILRPQMKQQKDHKAKLETLKRGDEVLTGGGLVGKVVRVDDTYADVEIAQGVKVKALKSTIVDVIQPGGPKPAND